MTQIQPITPVVVTPPVDGVHSTINLGVWAMLIALSADNKAQDAIQSAMADRTIFITQDVIDPLSQADEKKLSDYQKAMEAQSAYWQANGDKDSKGNDHYGQDMLAYTSGYNALKSSLKTNMDRETTQTDTLSNTVTSLNKEESSISSNMQTALTVYSSILDLGSELFG
jgi:hypothetical protein